MSYSSLSCAREGNPVRILSAKPEWHITQARFLRSLCIEKQGKKKRTCSIYSPSPSTFGYHRRSNEGDECFGSDRPDSFLLRQRYLRSYKLTREEGTGKCVSDKIKKWFEQKKKKTKGKSNKYPSGFGTCFNFQFCFVA